MNKRVSQSETPAEGEPTFFEEFVDGARRIHHDGTALGLEQLAQRNKNQVSFRRFSKRF